MGTMSRREAITSFTMVGSDHVAYQVAGEGPDLLYLPSINGSHVDARSGYEPANAWYRELWSFARTISLDRRGLGASDPPTSPVPFRWQAWLDDIVAVLDAVASERCTVFAVSDAVPLALLLAITSPERVRSVITFNALVRFGDPASDRAYETWGRDDRVTPFSPSASDEERRTLRRLQRMVASPGTALRIWRDVVRPIDGTDLLAAVDVPVLVLDRPARPTSHEGVRQVLDGVRQARLVALPGETMYLHEKSGAILEAVRDALAEHEDVGSGVRRLATVLFADVVGSTATAEAMGDHAWRTQLDAHDVVVRSIVELHGGRVVNTAGDGTVAIFEAPVRALRAAASLTTAPGALPLRVGLHTGEVELRGTDVAGIAVHVGARIGALAGVGEVLVSRTVRDLVAGSGTKFEPRGTHQLKGVEEPWEIHVLLLSVT